MASFFIIENRINTLLDIYERKLVDEKVLLRIYIYNDKIIFYLYWSGFIDEFIIRVPEYEEEMLLYLATKIIIRLFGKVMMHFDGKSLYNNVHLKNINVCIFNEKVKEIVNKLIELQGCEYINSNLPLVKELNKQVAKKKASRKYLKMLDKRLEKSRILLEGDKA